MKFAKNRSAFFKTQLSLTIQNQTTTPIPTRKQFQKWIKLALQGRYRTAQIGILLCSNDLARQYNQHYRQKDYATNVLSFPLDTPIPIYHDRYLFGDLILCPSIISQEATTQHKDLFSHYAHLIIHGILHLRGFDHILEDEAHHMESLEILLMNQLGYANPYQEG